MHINLIILTIEFSMVRGFDTGYGSWSCEFSIIFLKAELP